MPGQRYGKTAVFSPKYYSPSAAERPHALFSLYLKQKQRVALKIKKESDRFQKQLLDLSTELFYCGVSLNKHITLLIGGKKPHVIVAMPSRVLHLVKRSDLNLGHLPIFVSDEYDKMIEEVGKFTIR